MNRHITRESIIIRQARLARGYSQQRLAALIGVQVRQYQRVEYGETDVQKLAVHPALALCIVLGIDPVDLIFGSSPEALERLKGNHPRRARVGRKNRPVSD